MIELSSVENRGPYLIKFNPFIDERGFFHRAFCKKTLKDHGIDFEIKQINISFNKIKGTIRGMHFQRAPKLESKIIICLSGKIFDVIVDLRSKSSTYGNFFSFELDSNKFNGLYVPKGYAHGFQTLKNNTKLLYLHSENYFPEHEGGLNSMDPSLKIQWPISKFFSSDRDKKHPNLNNIKPL